MTKKMKPVKMMFNGSPSEQQMKEQHTAATSQLVMLDNAMVNGNDEKKPKAVHVKNMDPNRDDLDYQLNQRKIKQ